MVNINKLFGMIRGHRILLLGILCLFGFYAVLASSLQNGISKTKDDKSRIYLIHSDVLYKTKYDQRAEILVGNVQLSQDRKSVV